MDDHHHANDAAQLRRLARAIVAAGSDVGAMMEPAEALRALLERCSAFDLSVRSNVAEGQSRLADGVAISPMQAALCARQLWRSAAFIQGAAAALAAAARRCEGRPVRVLYAGCGPFALLALPLMALWPAGQAQFTLLDIHAASLASARTLVAHMGLDASVQAWVQADATAYRIDPAAPPDVILSETMSAALAHEPQVAIARHLLAQAPQALMVPAAVRIDACLCDPRRENGYEAEPRHDRIFLGKVFELDAAAVARWAGLPAGPLPAATIALPAVLEPRYQFRLLTRIEVFDGITLGDYASSLNLPRLLPGKPVLRGGDLLQFSYRLGADPGLAYRIQPAHP